MKNLLSAVLMILLLNQNANSQMSGVNCEDMEPFSSYITLPGDVTLNYMEQGNQTGLPVILIHGYTDSFHSFDSLMPYLNENYHLFAITMRGFGNSDKPQNEYSPENFARDISHFMEALKIESAVLVGHSMGATIVQRFALNYPSKTKAIVLISSMLNFRSNLIVKELCDAIIGMDSIHYSFVNDFQRSTIDKMIDSSYFKLLVGESMKCPLYVWKMVMTALGKVDYSGELKAIRVPALIIFGEKDGICTSKEQEEMRQLLKLSILISYADIGHAPHWEHPELVAGDINKFLQKFIK